MRQAITSVLSQDGVDFEVIVSDNASTDNTTQVIQEFKDPRLHYHRTPENLGPYAKGVRCFELAAGEYLTYLFDDDMMLPGNLVRKVKVLDDHPTVGFVYSNVLRMDGDGNPLPPRP